MTELLRNSLKVTNGKKEVRLLYRPNDRLHIQLCDPPKRSKTLTQSRSAGHRCHSIYQRFAATLTVGLTTVLSYHLAHRHTDRKTFTPSLSVVFPLTFQQLIEWGKDREVCQQDPMLALGIGPLRMRLSSSLYYFTLAQIFYYSNKSQTKINRTDILGGQFPSDFHTIQPFPRSFGPVTHVIIAQQPVI